MIDPRELRIGNLVYCGDEMYVSTKPEAVTADALYAADYLKNGLFFMPIPITPQWLERLGFVCHAIGYYHIGDTFLSYSNTGLHEYQFRGCPAILKHIHQLQNLFFALTGTELTIKQPEAT